MRRSGILLVLVTSVALAGCGSDETAAKKPVATVTTTAPEAVKTYVPAPGDPTKHIFHVTIRDEPPLDAYKAASDGKCVTVAPKQSPSRLLVAGPDREVEDKILAGSDLPTSARLLSDGSCESKVAITVPYTPHYTVAIIIEGRGIQGPTDPPDTNVTTKGSEQDITVLR